MSEKLDEKPVVYANAAEEIQAIELSIKRAQLADAEMQKLEREYNLQDLRARIGEREVKEIQKQENRAAAGRTFAQQRATDEQRFKDCSHRKGGSVSPQDMKALFVGGSAPQRAVIKHQMINGDVWVRCLRCGKTWLPPVKEKFFFDAKGRSAPATGKQAGVFDKEKFDLAAKEYHEAVKFETNNTMSGSVQCRFSKYNAETDQWVDAAQDYRKNLADTTLR
jgi:hypothetical protein